MTRNELASLISTYEGKKVEVSIGNIREVLRIIKQMLNDGVWGPSHGGVARQVYEGIDVLKALLK